VLRLQRGCAQAGGHVSVRLGLVAGASIALAIACAARPQPSTMAPPTAATANPHDEIERLSNEIEAERGQFPATGATPMVAVPEVPPPATCVRSPSETCSQTCTLSDSICRNAKQICDLADQLPGDAWAKQKCVDATNSCSTATRRCCECT
jgi:hypothetical protein